MEQLELTEPLDRRVRLAQLVQTDNLAQQVRKEFQELRDLKD